ncbi:MAG: hypothetical protein WA609_14840, partial [Terriglobales bacterium]
MISIATGLVLIPGTVALLVLLVFSYLYEQSRQGYFRAWQLAWAAYTLHYAVEAAIYFRGPSALLYFVGSLLLVAVAMCIFVSTRLTKEAFRLQWYDITLIGVGILLTYISLRAHMAGGAFRASAAPPPVYLRLETGLAAVLFYTSFHYYRYGFRKDSVAFRTLAFSLALWGSLIGAG